MKPVTTPSSTGDGTPATQYAMPSTRPSPRAIRPMPVTVELIVAGTTREKRCQRAGRMRSPSTSSWATMRMPSL
ncbi:hypothetical protein D3C77_796740 [compost metagenome]